MAAKRNRNQARRTGGNGTPGWVWLLIGAALCAVLFYVVPERMKKNGDGFFRPKPNPDAQPAPITEVDAAPENVAPVKRADEKSKQPEYEFYTLLPGKEVRMSDTELAASARAERERAEQERQRQLAAVQAARQTQAGTEPTPINESAANPTPATTQTVAGVTPDARYILQAGAFGASGDAEATKAKIALLGLSARVESAEIDGKTVYRVRMGPYGSASELADAKQKLANGGLPAVAIKMQ
jgi:cell division protein FtsN